MNISDKAMKEIIEAEEKCIGCKVCMKGCPMLSKFCENPKDLLRELKDKKEYDYSLPYSCMLCGYCSKVCPKNVDLKSIFMRLRKDIVEENNGKVPKELGTGGVDIHQKLSFSYLFTSDIENLQGDTIFFPGCGLISHSPKIVENTYSYLRTKINGIGIYTKCCGKPTAFLGKDEKFKEYYSILEKEFEDKNIKRIITGCQNCFMTIKNNSEDIEVVSLWEVIAKEGVPEDRKGIGRTINQKFTIHDPCPIRDMDIIHSSVRDILNDLGFRVEEMKYNRGETLCCGAGGLVPTTESDIAKEHTIRRANEADTEYIIAYCQECVESMRRGGKKSYHILDLLFNDNYQNMEQINQGLIRKWVNRYNGKKIGK